MSTRWFKNAIIYSVDVETFCDSDADGVGDFQGMSSKLDYLEDLGVTCIWLLPFYPSPNRDNGYDIKDYYGVEPCLGTAGDFVHFMHEAGERGMRVIVDLVLNHTSIDHPWFQAARSGHPKYRDFYVWRTEEPPDTSHLAAFPPEQEGIWTFDEKAKAWYMHRFYKWQPDLNVANPAVRQEMKRVMMYWLQLGVSGFRLDAAPFLIERNGNGGSPDKLKYDYSYLEEFREFLSWERGDAVILAEANVEKKLIPEYFGDENRMHMLFNFLANQQTFLSLARKSPKPLRKILEHLPPKPPSAQWAYFLRNHDELSLDHLSDKEEQEVYKEFAPEEDMRLFGRGIRRRLAPILGGDRARLEMVYSLLFTMPGAPVIWHGDEIGMGDDLSLEERNPVRTPMQWSSEPNGGFSTAPEKELFRPVITGGKWGYKNINAAGQQRDPSSLFRCIARMIRMRKCCPEFGLGEWSILKTDAEDAVLAMIYDWEGKTLAAVHNFTEEPVEVTLELSDRQGSQLVDVFGGNEDHPVDNGRCGIHLQAYGYRWLRLRE